MLGLEEKKSEQKSRDPYPYEIEQDEEKYHELSKYPDIASKLQRIRQLHLESVHYEALDHMKELEEYIKSKYDNKILDLYHSHPRIININTQIKSANKMINLMTSTDKEWILIKNDNEWSTEYKHDNNNPYHSFRLKGIGNVKMINILAIFFEMDLISNWMPLSKETYEIKQLSLYTKCGYARIGAFWPIKDRECVIFGFGIDDLKKNNKLLIYFDSNDKLHKNILNKFNIKLPKIENGRVRIDINIGGMLLEKVNQNKTKMSVVWNVDPKVYIPATLLNWFTGQFAGIFLSSIVKHASQIDKNEIYMERFKKNNEFYGAMMRKLSDKH
eukprot:32951_1